MKQKKIAIIGGGISGLTSGIYGRKAGFEVDVFEKNSVAGGECTGWDRQGFHIDNCIHWMMGTKDGTALNKIWRDVGAVGEGVEIIQSDQMYTSELGNERITLWKDLERTRQELLALSAQDQDEINGLMQYVRMSQRVQIPVEKPPEMLNALDAVKMGITMKDVLKLFRTFEGTDTSDLMNRFKHPLIRCVISDFCTKESLGHSFPMAYGNFAGGDGGIPRGGSRAMALRMQKKLESAGGKVHTNAGVMKIELERNKAAAVLLEDGRRVEADFFICSCDPYHTFHQLLDPSYMDAVFKEVYADRKAYPVYGMFQAAFAVDSELDAVGGDVNLDCGDIKTDSWMNDRMTVKTYAYEPAFAPEGKQLVQVLLGLSEESYDFWTALYPDRTAYRRKKEELAKAIQMKLEDRFSEYRGRMKILDSWTPVTYHRYCNAYKGYNQAFTITRYSMKNPYPPAYIKGIENCLLSGQWLSPPGGLPGAAIQGKYAVQRILKKEKRSISL